MGIKTQFGWRVLWGALGITAAVAATVWGSAKSGEEVPPGDDLWVEVLLPGASSISLTRAELLRGAVERKSVYFSYTDEHRICLVLPLEALMKEMVGGEATMLTSYSSDGYVSVFTPDFIRDYQPFIVLEIEGMGPGGMAFEGGPDLGPFFITYNQLLEPGYGPFPDPVNKRPYGVTKISVGTEESVLGPFFSSPASGLSASDARGRHLWVHNCMSCHQWTPADPGGHMSNRDAQVLSVHARLSPDYFRRFVVDPQEIWPGARMSGHPHYEEADIDAIRSFLQLYGESPR
jgi:cytochrome c2